jgi:hypothetical protein
LFVWQAQLIIKEHMGEYVQEKLIYFRDLNQIHEVKKEWPKLVGTTKEGFIPRSNKQEQSIHRKGA